MSHTTSLFNVNITQANFNMKESFTPNGGP